MKKSLVIVGVIVALILFLDQFTKVYIKSHFAPGESVSIFGDWFMLEYLENQGMAFGTTFGNKMWHKLALSVFRIFAISGMTYYLIKQAKQGAKRELLIVIGLIVAGATGNLIDSMFYDFVFPYDPCMGFNHLEGSGIVTDCGIFGEIETRHTGFLLGNVVDMFKFEAHWPGWMPTITIPKFNLFGHIIWTRHVLIAPLNEVFPAIWNLADASISVGVIMVLIRQRAYFPKEKKEMTKE